MDIENRSFVVTGGASGLGRAVAERLAGLNAYVVVADLNGMNGEATVKAIGNQATFVKTDVCDEAGVNAALDAAGASRKPLGGVVNCAGIGAAMKTLSKGVAHDLAIFRRVVEINLVGTFNVLRLTAARLEQGQPDANGERGIIVNTASIAAYDGQRGQVAYAASKGGVVGMTLPAARDLARSGIRVVTIAPGLFDTPLLAMLPTEARAALEAGVPFPSRLGKPTEYALLAEQIIRNPMLNGEVIRLDGALRMQP